MEINGLHFVPFIGAAELAQTVDRLAAEIGRDYAGRKPVICPVLTGSFIFAADLVRRLHLDAEVRFVNYTSYEGTRSSGRVVAQLPFPPVVRGRDVIIVEDIIDTGLSMEHMLAELHKLEPASVRVCALFYKPQSCTRPVRPHYVGREIGNEFIVGYGLDYDGHGRMLDAVYVNKGEG